MTSFRALKEEGKNKIGKKAVKLHVRNDNAVELTNISGQYSGLDIKDIVLRMASQTHGIKVKNRIFKMKVYKNCFIADEAVTWLVSNLNWSEDKALVFMSVLLSQGHIALAKGHQTPKHKVYEFLKGNYFYVFLTVALFKKTKILTRPVEKILATSTLDEVMRKARDPVNGIEVNDREFGFKSYPNCFVANEAVTWLVENLSLRNRAEGIVWGQHILDRGFIVHFTQSQPFTDTYSFFRWVIARRTSSSAQLNTSQSLRNIDVISEVDTDTDGDTEDLQITRIKIVNYGPSTITQVQQLDDQQSEIHKSNAEEDWRKLSSVWSNITSISFRKFITHIGTTLNLGEHKISSILPKGYILSLYSNNFVVSTLSMEEQVVLPLESKFITCTADFPRIYSLYGFPLTLKIYDVLCKTTEKYQLDVKNSNICCILSDSEHLILVSESKILMTYLGSESSTFIEIDRSSTSFVAVAEKSALNWPYLLLASDRAFEFWNIKFGELICHKKTSDDSKFFSSVVLQKNNLFASCGKDLFMWLLSPKRLPLQEPNYVQIKTNMITSMFIHKYKHNNNLLSILISGDISGTLTARNYTNQEIIFEVNSSEIIKKNLKKSTSSTTDAEFKINAILAKQDIIFVGHEEGALSIWKFDYQEKSCTFKQLFRTPLPVINIKLYEDIVFIVCEEKGIEEKHSVPLIGIMPLKLVFESKMPATIEVQMRKATFRAKNHVRMSVLWKPQNTIEESAIIHPLKTSQQKIDSIKDNKPVPAVKKSPKPLPSVNKFAKPLVEKEESSPKNQDAKPHFRRATGALPKPPTPSTSHRPHPPTKPESTYYQSRTTSVPPKYIPSPPPKEREINNSDSSVGKTLGSPGPDTIKQRSTSEAIRPVLPPKPPSVALKPKLAKSLNQRNHTPSVNISHSNSSPTLTDKFNNNSPTLPNSQ